jgi:hypothetical protein
MYSAEPTFRYNDRKKHVGFPKNIRKLLISGFPSNISDFEQTALTLTVDFSCFANSPENYTLYPYIMFNL